MIRSYDTLEEGVSETLSESWTIPKSAEDLGKKGPKATYAMTKNRGIVLANGVEEGTWRMRWEISGITDITADKEDMKDSSGLRMVRKSYSNNEFAVDVNDFINSQKDINSYSYSEFASGNKAQVLFYNNGTTGDRIVDPTIVTSNIARGWADSSIRNVFYNGTNFFVFYDKGSTSVFAKGASTIANLASATEQTVINAEVNGTTPLWNMYMVNDTKFDIVYNLAAAATSAVVRTCTVSDTTISCASASATRVGTSNAKGTIAITRTPSGDRIWIAFGSDVVYANQTGDSNNIMTWTNPDLFLGSIFIGVTLVPYNSSDKVLVVTQSNRAGQNDDGVYYMVCLSTDTTACTTPGTHISTFTPTAANAGNAVQISDTDFRYIFVDGSATTNLIEAQFDGSTTWAFTTTIDSAGGQTNPSLFYDSQENIEYAFYADSATPKSIQRYRKPTAATYSTAWDSKTDVDNGESDDNSLPVTQMHEPPLGATQTRTPRELTWCWRNANTTNFDVVCANLNLAAVSGPTLDQLMRHGNWFSNGVGQTFTF
jgi:hypothetical protein